MSNASLALRDYKYEPAKLKCYKRVWKGILGIRYWTKIRRGNRENDKYLDEILHLTAPREAGLAKI